MPAGHNVTPHFRVNPEHQVLGINIPIALIASIALLISGSGPAAKKHTSEEKGTLLLFNPKFSMNTWATVMRNALSRQSRH